MRENSTAKPVSLARAHAPGDRKVRQAAATSHLGALSGRSRALGVLPRALGVLVFFGGFCLGDRSLEAQEGGAPAFARAAATRSFQFPRDHGNHPRFKTEWWYFTGVLESASGATYGFQATWFRFALTPEEISRNSKLGVRDLFFFHGAVTDLAEKTFQQKHTGSRGRAGWAGASTNTPHVFVLEDSARLDDKGVWQLEFEVNGRQLLLQLEATRPPLLHGAAPGLSLKGPRPGQASYYASQTRLKATGVLRPADAGLGGQDSPQPSPGPEDAVLGQVWFDHEFGANQLAEDQIGWDWFSVALEDGTDLMLYLLRRKDGTVEPASSGTLRLADGRRIHIPRSGFTVEVLSYWTSPASGTRYPARWRLGIPARGVSLDVRPLLAEQELQTPGTTGITYWEGVCDFSGRVGKATTQGRGYVELVGYGTPFAADI